MSGCECAHMCLIKKEHSHRANILNANGQTVLRISLETLQEYRMLMSPLETYIKQ